VVRRRTGADGGAIREVEVLTDSSAESAEAFPASWLNLKKSPGVIRFTHAHYDQQQFDSELRQYWPAVQDVSVRAIPLRFIFIALASQRTPGS